jgi:hypothetical protein
MPEIQGWKPAPPIFMILVQLALISGLLLLAFLFFFGLLPNLQ